MNSKDILIDAIKLKKTSRLPVILLSGGVWAFNQHGMSLQDTFDMAPQEVANYIIHNNKQINTDLIWTASGCNNLVLRGIGAQTTFNVPGVAASVDEALIKKVDEIEKLNISNIENDPGIANLLESTRILAKEIGKHKLIGISQWGPMTLAGLIMGTENFMMLSIKDKQAANHLLEFTTQLVIKYWSLFVEAGAELVSQAEPSASCDMISPRQFSDMAIPYLKKTNEFIADKVLVKMVHICGNTTKILEKLPATDSDIISLDYKVDLKVAREKLNGVMAFAGQIDPVQVLQTGSVKDVELATLKCIEDAGLEGGYVVMPGCDLPPAVPMINVQTMVNTVLNYNKI